MSEVQKFLEIVAHANERQKAKPSVVCNSVASTMRGEFGDIHATGKTNGSELFINPLMTLYWMYDLAAVCRKMEFYADILDTLFPHEVWTQIQRRRHKLTVREFKSIPL